MRFVAPDRPAARLAPRVGRARAALCLELCATACTTPPRAAPLEYPRLPAVRVSAEPNRPPSVDGPPPAPSRPSPRLSDSEPPASALPDPAWITLRVIFDAGSASDPPQKEGLALVTARLMAEGGAGGLERRARQRALWPMAGTIRVEVSRDQTAFVGEAHVSNIDAFYPILRDTLRAPHMERAEFERVRDDVRRGLSRRPKPPGRLARQLLHALLYRGHPYAHPVAGEDTSLAQLTVNDAIAHRSRVFCTKNARVGVAGPVPPGWVERVEADLVDSAETVCADDAGEQTQAASEPAAGGPGEADSGEWGARPSSLTRANNREAGNAEASPAAGRNGLAGNAGVSNAAASRGEASPDSTEPSVWLLEDAGRAAASLAMGMRVDAKPGHPDYPALKLAAAALGDRWSPRNRLTEAFRARGLAARVYACVDPGPCGPGASPGPPVGRRFHDFWISVPAIRTDNIPFAVRLVHHVLANLVQEGLTQAAWSAVRARSAARLPLIAHTPASQLRADLVARYYGLDKPIHSQLNTAWAALTRSRFRQVLHRHLDPDRLSIAIVTPDPTLVARLLRTTSPPRYRRDVTPRLRAADAHIAQRPLWIEPNRVRVVPSLAASW